MSNLRKYKAGEVIIIENDTGETAYAIEQGRVEITKDREGQKIHIAYLNAGETIGEMSMVDDRPRSATVTATEETTAREIHRDEFFKSLKTDPEVAMNVLKVLFERLREANVTILQLQKEGVKLTQTPEIKPKEESTKADVTVFLEGLTQKAVSTLPENPFCINKFPFRIGRDSADLLALNDLMISDSMPLQISRHHVSIIKQEGHVGVLDRGSTLGSLVDGKQLGGEGGIPDPLFFESSGGTLVLGDSQSPFRYKVLIRSSQ
jgi:CRP-like cAMP-binding protein